MNGRARCSVQGEQALAFLRARAAFGDGGVLGIPGGAVEADASIHGIQIYRGDDARDGIGKLEAPDITGTISQTADQVSCQNTNPIG